MINNKIINDMGKQIKLEIKDNWQSELELRDMATRNINRGNKE